MIIGIAGKAGSGKSTAAAILVDKLLFTEISLADPMKRFLKELMNWSEARLWGASEKRAEPDTRYRVGRECITARGALQQLGTEFGRNLHPDIWVDYLLHQINGCRLAGCGYDKFIGLIPKSDKREIFPSMDFVVPDIRFENEARAVQRNGGGVIFINRPGAGLGGKEGEHASEILSISYDVEINNTGTLLEFEYAVLSAVIEIRKRGSHGLD